MNWEAIGAVGETLGSIAVLITLIYLSNQIRHARSEFRLSVAQDRYDTYRGLTLETVHNSDLARIVNTLDEAWNPKLTNFEALEEAANLNSVDKRRFHDYKRAWFMYRVQTIEQIEHLSADQREAFDNMTGLIYSTGVTGLWFERHKQNVSTGGDVTTLYIDRLIAKRSGT